MTAFYAEIGVKGIQRYLARTPRLRGRRGASARLADATNQETMKRLLGARAKINEEAGSADGVVSLIVDRDPEAIVDDVLAYLRTQLPGAEFQAAWSTGVDYLHAYQAIKESRTAGRSPVTAPFRTDLPVPPEFPFAAPCRLCRTAHAVDEVKLGDREVRQVCADCRMRESHGTRSLGKDAEHRLARQLGVDRVQGFDELARLDPRDDSPGSPSGNHLATVYADGNSMGILFDRLAEDDGALKKVISRKVSEHTWTALVRATEQVRRPGEKSLCVVPHVVGGDDVLVSLPAARAWPFVLAFLNGFGELMAETLGERPGLPIPSASAGLIIAHVTTPFSLVVDNAERGLKQAKRLTRGRGSSVHALDVTVDGTDGARFPALKADDLRDATADLERLLTVPPAGRSNLLQELAVERDPVEGVKRAETLAKRMGFPEKIEPFTGGGPIGLGHALRIVRWWR
ncbi:Cas10/Cmr2 second palm domain-containing protein [Rhizohabitans arisaemae]|uniref:Cas10/Cmr2 second palm domain-containing protein n=1 Tax=Rhizohabitans arisaemae TaxID=2720610 RepID=UPI0024B1BBEF|nr:hypothetical protein [Rhizohabitans arisaemae]